MSAPASMQDDVRKFEEIGTYPIAHRGAITEAITFHEGIGVERKAERLRFLRRRWTDLVGDLPGVTIWNSDQPEQSCGIGAAELTEFLEKKYFIHVRPRYVDGEFTCIRVTPNVFSTLEEVDLFATAVEDAARNGVSA